MAIVRALGFLRRTDEAIATAERLYFEALAERQSAIAVDAANDLAFLWSVDSDEVEHGQRWLRFARAHLHDRSDRERVGVTLHTHGVLDLLSGRPNHAIAHYEGAIAYLATTHRLRTSAMYNLAMALYRLGHLHEATTRFEQGLAMQIGRLGPRHPEHDLFFEMVSRCHLEQGT